MAELFLLQHAGSLGAACGIQFPDQGLNPGLLRWSGRPPEYIF